MVFIRKVVLILCCISVVVAMAIPTFAASDGPSGSSGVRVASIPFDYITFTNEHDGQHVVAEWPFNYFRPGTDNYGSSGNSDNFGWGSSNLTKTSFDGFFVPVGADSFTLHCDAFAYPVSRDDSIPDSFRFTDELGNDYLHFSSVQMSGYILLPFLNGNEYSLRKLAFDRVYTISGTDTPDLFTLLTSTVSSSIVNDGGNYPSNRWYMLQSLEIKVNYAWEQEAESRLIGYRTELGAGRLAISTWFNEMPLPVESVQAEGVLSWLTRSVQSFMDFELFPGLSFSKVYWFFLVILIVLWFVKLIR